MEVIKKAKDNSIKMVLDEPEMFVSFLKDFIPIDILKDIEPSDIEDVTTSLLTLVAEQKDSDTIKRIKLKGDTTPLFIIAVVEHESKVNFRAPFKMLLYIALILDAYEKEITSKEDGNPAMRKDFKYPPILPIIFYDGDENWTSETNFLYKTAMHEIFEKYIPKFEYILVNLKDYSVSDLTKFNNLLSLFMILDKMKKPDDLSRIFSSLPEDYIQKLNINVPDHLKTLMANVARVLMTKINVPQDEIDEIAEKIQERGVTEMFNIENYDVQATRSEAREEGFEKGIERGFEKGFLEAAIALIESGMHLKEVIQRLNLSDSQIVYLEEQLA